MQQRKHLRILALALVTMTSFIGSYASAEEEGPKIYYKDGLHIDSADGKNTLHLSGRVQGRFTYNALEAAADNNTFAIQRGKIKLNGNVFSKKLAYEFQMNLATRNRAATTTVCVDAGCTTTTNAVTAESTTGLATLEDFNIDYTPFDFFGIKAGQFKAPFLMQELTSSGKQQFVDRSLSSGFFNFGRDIGIALHGDLPDYHVNYSLFAMNGDGANEINRNQGVLTGLRIEVPILGKYKPTETDVEYSEGPNLGFGIAYAYNERGSSFENGTIAANVKASHGTFDVGYKYHGISLQGAGMISRTMEGAKLTNWGYNAQAGYFFIPKHLEAAAKASGAIFSDAAVNQYEYSAGLNYFVNGHSIKLQTDYAYLLNNRGLNLNDHRIRTQLQLIF